MNEYVLSAFIFGLTAGFKPGPLGLVVIQQTLEHGLKHGVRASRAPIITDVPIIILALATLSQVRDIDPLVGFLSFAGGLYLLWLSLKIVKVKQICIAEALVIPKSLETAIKVNLLSPNPYIFWFAVGGTYLALGTQSQSMVFIVVTIGTLVGSKMVTAWIAANFREILDGNAYVVVMRVLGSSLAVFGVVLIIRGKELLVGKLF